MEFILEIIVELLFLAGIVVFRWCIRHKEITYAVLCAALMVADVFVWLKLLGKI